MFLELLILHLIATAISLFGGLLMWRHQSQWNQQQADPELEAGERRFLHGQYRRRMQTSGMILLLGLLLNASNEHLVQWQKAPVGFFVYVSLMLVLVAWIIILAVVDYIANRVVHQKALARLREQQKELELKVAHMRHNRQH